MVLYSEQYRNHNFISATAPNSKILMEGYINTVDLFGNLKVGDLKIEGITEIHFTGKSDLYGTILDMQRNDISVSGSGTLTLHPGAVIHSNSNSVNFTDYSVTTFKSGTNVATYKLKATNNAKIIIDDSATVNFNCELILNNNTELELKPGAVLHLQKLTAQSTSKITMHAGSMIFLDCGQSHVAGKIVAEGSNTNHPIRLRSKMEYNCYDPTAPEFLNSHSSCYANLRYAQAGSSLGVSDIRNVNLSRYKTENDEFETLYETSIVSIEPNPTSADANVTYSISEQGMLSITLCNTLGQEVLKIHNDFQEAGMFTKPFSTSGLAKGIYFMKMLTGSETKVEKVIVN